MPGRLHRNPLEGPAGELGAVTDGRGRPRWPRAGCPTASRRGHTRETLRGGSAGGDGQQRDQPMLGDRATVGASTHSSRQNPLRAPLPTNSTDPARAQTTASHAQLVPDGPALLGQDHQSQVRGGLPVPTLVSPSTEPPWTTRCPEGPITGRGHRAPMRGRCRAGRRLPSGCACGAQGHARSRMTARRPGRS